MVVTKPADFRKNQKEYFEIAYKGEPVLIVRPRNENVVIIGDSKYRELEMRMRLLTYYYKCRESGKSDDIEDVVRQIEDIMTD